MNKQKILKTHKYLEATLTKCWKSKKKRNAENKLAEGGGGGVEYTIWKNERQDYRAHLLGA